MIFNTELSETKSGLEWIVPQMENNWKKRIKIEKGELNKLLFFPRNLEKCLNKTNENYFVWSTDSSHVGWFW